MFDHRNDLKWSFCCVCGQPTMAILSPEQGPETIICFSCTGNHPHILDKPDRAEYLQKCSEDFLTLGELSLAQHYNKLAAAERARPRLKPFEDHYVSSGRHISDLGDLGIDI